MKRGASGGAYRGPLQATRQRRTLRLMQVLLVVLGAALFVFAGYSWGRVAGFEAGRRAGDVDAPRPPSWAQSVVLAALGAGAVIGAGLLQQSVPRLPQPARLDELAGGTASVTAASEQ
ncbi:MAG TPA: hypothetical protein VHJ82_06575 [Actinomycetota bacterium]|nr:hypothetical protein [Actinomycetota bacterium]